MTEDDTTEEIREWARRLFSSIDNRDGDAFAAFLADDVEFRFGNAEPVKGRAAVHAAVSGFFQSISAVRHQLDRVWRTDDAAVCHGNVTYTRHDGSTLGVPFANVMYLRDGLVVNYLIFADVSSLYNTA